MKAQLSYEILDSHKNFGDGHIYSIIEPQNGYWRCLVECSQIVIRCGLHYSSQIHSIILKLEDIDMIEFKGYQNGQNVFTVTKSCTQKQKDSQQPLKHTFQDTHYASEVFVHLHNYTKKKSAVFFLGFVGSVDYSKPHQYKKKIKKTSASFIKGPSQAQLKQQSKYQEENYDKQTKTTPKLQLYKQDDIEDDLCLKQTNAKVKVFKINKSYFSKCFDGISEKWLRNQKKIQFSERIPPKYQLSVLIDSKCFQRKLFCIMNTSQSLKKELIIKIKELGGFIRQQPCPDSYLITPIMTGGNVKLGLLMKNVIFVKPSYVDDCYEARSLLGIKKYKPDHQ